MVRKRRTRGARPGTWSRPIPTRQHVVRRLEMLVADYNAGSVDAEQFFHALKAFIGEMEQRAAREGLTEKELAIFDLLTNPAPKLTKAEEQEVKRVARSLLEKLHDRTRAIDWFAGRKLGARSRPRSGSASTN